MTIPRSSVRTRKTKTSDIFDLTQRGVFPLAVLVKKCFNKGVEMLVYALIFILILAADQLVKYWAISVLMPQGTIPVIENVFRLSYVENRGAAFSILQGGRVFFIVLTVVMLGVMIWAFAKNFFKGKWGKTTLVFIFSGAVGNFIDRVVRGYVVDMLDFCLINFPVFNIADIFLTIGEIMAIIYVIFIDRDLLGEKNRGDKKDKS